MSDLTRKLIPILGGTFDPIHVGHLQILDTIHNDYQIPQVVLVPCSLSPLKERPHAPSFDRLQMIKLAVQDRPYVVVEEYELNHEGPSYTVKTLEYLYKIHGDRLAFIMGMDSFNTFEEWRDWQQILKMASLILVERDYPPSDLRPSIRKMLYERECTCFSALQAGEIFRLKMEPKFVSSTQVREWASQGKDLAELVLPAVSRYIYEKHLYQI